MFLTSENNSKVFLNGSPAETDQGPNYLSGTELCIKQPRITSVTDCRDEELKDSLQNATSQNIILTT